MKKNKSTDKTKHKKSEQRGEERERGKIFYFFNGEVLMKGLVTAASVHAFRWPLTGTLSSTSSPAQDSPPFTPPPPTAKITMNLRLNRVDSTFHILPTVHRDL